MNTTYTAFAGDKRLATGSLLEVALQAKAFADGAPLTALLIFDDSRGDVVDLSLRGTVEELRKRVRQRSPSPAAPAADVDTEPSGDSARGRGRPKLGVVAREVTLLPRHWEWLNSQPGSASVVLRRLVEDARRSSASKDRCRQSQKATYLFMSAMAGDRGHFEDAVRALFAGDRARFRELIRTWPVDIQRHVELLSHEAFDDATDRSPS